MRVRAALAVAVALAVAGCSTQTASSSSGSSASVNVSGNALRVYISDPQDVRSDPSLQDVVDGAQLAFKREASAVTKYKVALQTLTNRLPSQNARQAIRDKQAIAYIGEIKSGDSVQTAGITEALDLVELSPTETATVPDGAYELLSTYGRTFIHLPSTPPKVSGFSGLFKSAYGHRPGAQAVYGYQAMNLVLEALHSLGSSANDRGSVVKAVRKLASG